MKLVNMKSDGETCAPCPVEAYPYGLRLCLNSEQCEALGILGPISPGTVVQVVAMATVVRCTESTESADEPDEDGNDIALDLQITDMGIEAPGASTASMLWPDKDK